MIYSIFAQRDATIYERSVELNSGIDSLLEISHEQPGSGSNIFNARVLIKFDVSDIQSKINSNKISSNAKYYLSLITADVRDIPQEYKIYAYPVSSSWTNGTGRWGNNPITKDGVSWKYFSSKNNGIYHLLFQIMNGITYHKHGLMLIFYSVAI